ncbi:MAG: hypothetical protein IT454_12975 [Planctomycetes bacterium]|nr:hypothetical protein [Planctomycetota bacterium]
MSSPRALPRLESRVDGRSHRRFLEVTGRRSALLGNELGVFEAWIWPLKVASELELSVRTDVLHRGRDLARSVAFQPDCTEICYEGPDFRVRQVLFAALDRRALVLEIEVETERALELEIGFVPEFKPMWPAGLGGRIALRDDESGALALTEELGRFAALLGSPEAEPVSVVADHALPRQSLALRIPVSRARAARGAIPFFVVGAEVAPRALSERACVGEEGAASGHARSHEVLRAAREEYRWIVAHWRDVRRELQAHWHDFLERTTHFESDDARHTEAFLWAKVAIEKAWVEVDGLGRGLVAGLSPSGSSERPGFGWFFDGDALVASRAMVAYGDRKGARRVLDFAASHQRADGKLMHELVLSARLCDWFQDYPYAYYKAQLTPGFVSCLDHYLSFADDAELRQQLWPNVLAAYRCCLANLEESGYLSNRTLGIAAVEAGSLVGKIRAEIYLQGIWISALRGVQRMARTLCDVELERDASLRLAAANELFERFWSAEEGRYGFARLEGGALNRDSTSYQALPLSRHIGAPHRALASAAALNRPNLASDWGVRLFADDASVYDTASYNTGSVFPYTNNFAILAQFAHGLTTSGHQLLASQVALHGFSGLGFVPEHLCADRCEAPPRGVPHQIFSSSCILQSTLFGVFGLVADAREGRVELAPHLPVSTQRAALSGVRVADAQFDVEFSRTPLVGRTRVSLHVRAARVAPLELLFQPWLAPLSRRAQCKGSEVRLERCGAAMRPCLTPLALGQEAEFELELEFESGPELVLDVAPLVEGERSSELRVCEVEFDESSVTWTLWAPAGSKHALGVHSDRRLRFEGCSLSSPQRLQVEFPVATRPSFVSTKIRAIALD